MFPHKRIIDLAQPCVNAFASILQGGCHLSFHVATTRHNLITDPPVLNVQIVADERGLSCSVAERLYQYAPDKVRRCALKGHLSSAQSEAPDPDINPEGGIVILGSDGRWYGMGVAGLPKLANEALAAALLMALGPLDRVTADRAMAFTQNPNLDAMIEAMRTVDPLACGGELV